MNIKDKLRKKWFRSMGFYAPNDNGYIPDTMKHRAENAQSNKPAARKPYLLGEKPYARSK